MRRRIATVLALGVLCVVAPSAAAADGRIAEGSAVFVCSVQSVDCGAQPCLLANKRVSLLKALLHDARRTGSPSEVRKAKQRLAKAKRDRRHDCRGFV